MPPSHEQARVLTLVFTDLAGSTALKQARGDHAGRDIMAQHRALLRAQATDAHGRVIDWAGDGCFLTFDTSSAAVVFALKLQAAHAQDHTLPGVRIGIHIGEVTESPLSGVDFGDTDTANVRVEGIAVDIAARICSLARPGQILMSSAVRTAAQSRIAPDRLDRPVAWRDYGPYRLKGFDVSLEIAEAGVEGVAAFKAPATSDKVRRERRHTAPVVLVLGSIVVAAAIAASIYPVTRRLDAPVMDAPLTPIESVVVLPFEDRTGDDANSYLTLGLGEELSSELGKVGSLVVLAHSAARDEIDAAESRLEIARKLNAHAAIDGSVSRAGDRIRVRVALVRTQNAQQIWTDVYDLEGGDLLALQSRWALEVATALRATITPEERDRLARSRPADPEAERAYMNGLNHWWLRTREGFIDALAEYNRAVRIDPTYADAYGALAAAWAAMADYSLQPPEMACGQALEFANKALELDDSIIEARLAQGICTFLLDRDYGETVRLFDELERMEPSNSNAVYWRAMNLFRIGEFEQALEINVHALRLNPTSPLYYSGRAAMLLGAGRNTDALDFTTDAMVGYGDDLSLMGMHTAALLRNGRIEEARAALDTRKDEVPPYAFWLMRYGAYRALAGQPEFARDALKILSEQSGYTDPGAFAGIHAALGEIDTAFDYIDQALDAHSALLPSIIWDPAWDNLRTDPRYIETLHKLGLTDFAAAEQAKLAAEP